MWFWYYTVTLLKFIEIRKCDKSRYTACASCFPHIYFANCSSSFCVTAWSALSCTIRAQIARVKGTCAQKSTRSRLSHFAGRHFYLAFGPKMADQFWKSSRLFLTVNCRAFCSRRTSLLCVNARSAQLSSSSRSILFGNWPGLRRWRF